MIWAPSLCRSSLSAPPPRPRLALLPLLVLVKALALAVGQVDVRLFWPCFGLEPS